MNNSGKVLTIFIIIALILMLSLTAMFAFRFYQESELRKLAEVDLNQLKESEAKLQADLKEAKRQIYLLEEKIKNYQIQLGEDITMINNSDSATMTEPPQVKLDPIVVRPMGDVQGKILTVDQDTQFIIFDLAEGEGVLEGSVMSVYRGNEYLGDIKVTRVQPEMSAADFIPPLTSQHVNKDDLVIPKAKE